MKLAIMIKYLSKCSLVFENQEMAIVVFALNTLYTTR